MTKNTGHPNDGSNVLAFSREGSHVSKNAKCRSVTRRSRKMNRPCSGKVQSIAVITAQLACGLSHPRGVAMIALLGTGSEHSNIEALQYWVTNQFPTVAHLPRREQVGILAERLQCLVNNSFLGRGDQV